MWAVQRNGKGLGKTLKEIESQEREGTVFEGLFGGRIGENGDGKKGTEVFGVTMEKLRERKGAISKRKFFQHTYMLIPHCVLHVQLTTHTHTRTSPDTSGVYCNCSLG
jgi:hypothetical protein